MIKNGIVKYILTCFSIQPFLFQLVDESNVEITPSNFQNDISNYDFILENASYTNLLKAFHFVKQQNNEMYNDTIAKITDILESASYTNLLKAFHFFQEQNDEKYDDTKKTLAAIFLNRVSNSTKN